MSFFIFLLRFRICIGGSLIWSRLIRFGLSWVILMRGIGISLSCRWFLLYFLIAFLITFLILIRFSSITLICRIFIRLLSLRIFITAKSWEFNGLWRIKRGPRIFLLVAKATIWLRILRRFYQRLIIVFRLIWETLVLFHDIPYWLINLI